VTALATYSSMLLLLSQSDVLFEFVILYGLLHSSVISNILSIFDDNFW